MIQKSTQSVLTKKRILWQLARKMDSLKLSIYTHVLFFINEE